MTTMEETFARAVESLRRRLPETAAQTATELLEVERPEPALTPEARARAVSRVRALIAGNIPRRLVPAPRRAPWLALGAIGLVGLSAVAVRAVRVGSTQSNMSTPRSITSSTPSGSPMPMK